MRLSLSRKRNAHICWPEVKAELIVVSPGGVATTNLISHLERFVRVNCSSDSDGLKHLARPPTQDQMAGRRFLYIYGDVEVVCRSLERRGWTLWQAVKLGSSGAALSFGRVSRFFLKQAVKRQINEWTRVNNENLMVLSFCQVFEAADELASFIGVEDPEFVLSFPKRRDRVSETGSNL